jgi:MFS family permease
LWLAVTDGFLRAKNMPTVLASRFIIGLAGSIGSGIVGGSIADIYVPAHRGMPMLLGGFVIYASTGIGGMAFAFVTTHLGWRWVWWIHISEYRHACTEAAELT